MGEERGYVHLRSQGSQPSKMTSKAQSPINQSSLLLYGDGLLTFLAGGKQDIFTGGKCYDKGRKQKRNSKEGHPLPHFWPAQYSWLPTGG